MRITQFQDASGQIHLGDDQGGGIAEVLRGSLFSGLEATGEKLSIERRLVPYLPTNILCIGLNYRAHADETGIQYPEHPILFMKPTSAISHPGHPISLPACGTHEPEVDYEAELAVIIGRSARNVSEADALDYVFGYSCANDISARHWQMHGGGGQWVRGKSFDTFCPFGPVIVTSDEIADPQSLDIRCRLNGELMQDGNTADMIFSIATLVSYLSQDTTLLPGTLILTGTPSGVGFTRTPPVYLKSGDHVEVEIEGIGALTNPVFASS